MSEVPVPVVFVHGLWVHASAWAPWEALFAEHGYAPVAPGWPGEPATTEQARSHPEAVAGVGIQAVTDAYAEVIAALPAPPVVVGHSFGGLVVEKLLAAGLARAAVAIAPTQPKGVLGLPPVQLRNALPVLARPWLLRGTWMHSRRSFAQAFANAVPRAEADALHDRFVIPSPGRPLFEAGLANLVPRSSAAVDVRRERGPLLLLAGSADRTVPASTVRATYRLQQKGAGVTELEVLEGRGHSLVLDSGWRDVATRALEFLTRHGVQDSATAAR